MGKGREKESERLVNKGKKRRESKKISL